MFKKFLPYKPDSVDSIYGRIIGRDPIVTFSYRYDDAPLGIAGLAPEFFRKTEAVHFIGYFWHNHRKKLIREFREKLEHLSKYLVNNHFIYVANTQYDAWLLNSLGVTAIQSVDTLSVDDSIFGPHAEQTWPIEPHDVIYNARLREFKRHQLAYGLDKLALLYTTARNGLQRYDELRQAKPGWTFINHEAGNGEFRMLDKKAVAGILNQCRVGLCLSGYEGAMRASMEYLLSGIPVVSTQSIGGRDRYYDNENCIFVRPDPDAVVAAVNTWLEKPPDRASIRQSILAKLDFDRSDLIRTINQIIYSLHDVRHHVDSYDRIIGLIEKHRTVDEILGDLKTR